MFGGLRSLLARHIGPLLFCARNEKMSILEYFLVFFFFFFFFFCKTAPRCSDPGIDFLFCSVFEV